MFKHTIAHKHVCGTVWLREIEKIISEYRADDKRSRVIVHFIHLSLSMCACVCVCVCVGVGVYLQIACDICNLYRSTWEIIQFVVARSLINVGMCVCNLTNIFGLPTNKFMFVIVRCCTNKHDVCSTPVSDLTHSLGRIHNTTQ